MLNGSKSAMPMRNCRTRSEITFLEQPGLLSSCRLAAMVLMITCCSYWRERSRTTTEGEPGLTQIFRNFASL
jgi:hypothetical protein